MTITKTLENALLADGPMARALFQRKVKKRVKEFIRVKRDDNANHLFAVSVNSGDAAMLFIDRDDAVYENEKARGRLQELWSCEAYQHNMRVLLPQMVERFESGAGVYVFSVHVE